jgi:hypothetical protein
MPESKDAGRTHEPSLREVTAELDGLKEFLIEKIESVKTTADERDRRYEDRFTAIDEKTGLALSTSKEAVNKSEVAVEKRFDSVNEFRGTLSDQAATLLPRPEAAAKFAAYDEKLEDMKKDIIALREFRSEGSGRMDATKVFMGILMTAIGIVIGFIAKLR